MKVCVVIAAYNEGPNLAAVIRGIRPFIGEDDEILVVDDGSTDDTSEVARQAGARVVRLEPNQGKGMAIRRGLQEATGDAVLFIDGDGQDPPDDIPALLAEMEKGADLVNGSKFIGTLKDGAISKPNYFGNLFMSGFISLLLKDGAISKPNYFGNLFMSGFISLLFGVKITDSQSGFRCFRGEKLQGIRLDAREYEIETEMLIKAIRRGFHIVEVPVTRDRRAAGATNFKRIRNGLRILGTILKLRFTRA
jgi:glycosyltransferase involved in cell wall biosynthesis